MAIAPVRMFKNSFEFFPLERVDDVPARTRGLYVLYNKDADGKFNVVYIGMARGEKSGAKARLRKHRSTKSKAGLWTHFSVFEVWDNVSKQEIEELEGLFRHLYRN